MADKQLILALDIGSSSVRAAFFDHGGNLLPRTLVKFERKLKATPLGGSEIDANAAFRQVVNTIDAAMANAPKGEITHVASCTFWHSLLGVDSKGRPTTPVYGWADNQSRECVATLRKKLDERETHDRTGARFHPSFWPAKLLWLQGGNTSSSECALFTKTSHWISIGDYITLKLSGKLATSISIASGTGIFNLRENGWDEKLLRLLKIKRSQLPKIEKDSYTFRLNAKFAKRWPRLTDANWFLPTADGATNNIGSGCVTSDTAALMVGTSGAMRVVLDTPPKSIPEGLWCYRVDHRRAILGGALSDGGGLLDWLRANLNLPKNAESIISKRLPAKSPVKVEPYFAGERSTGYNENATGSIRNLTMADDAVDVYQAAMEAIADRFAEIFRQLEIVTPIRKIIASGGGLHNSHAFTRIISNALGRDLTLSEVPEASMRGAVLLALETIGKIQIADSDSK
ncbi:MAG TPA: gluconokinase [Pyrinomonadaceae bacterium]|nr:gluconokinase [Pyrinomonadaceae bacterium]